MSYRVGEDWIRPQMGTHQAYNGSISSRTLVSFSLPFRKVNLTKCSVFPKESKVDNCNIKEYQDINNRSDVT